MKRIMFVTWSSSFGGAEKILCFLANSLAQSKKYEAVLYIYQADRELFWDIDPNVRVITERPISNKRGIRRLLQLKQVVSRIRKEKPDVIVSFLTLTNVICTLAGKLTGVPVIISERGDPKRVSRRFKKIVSYAAGAVFQTEGAKNEYPEKLQRKSIVIPNPVVLPLPENIKTEYQNSHIISNVARQLNSQKRQDLLLQAFSIVLSSFPDSELHFYGDGPDEENNRKLAEELGVIDHVFFHGVTKNALDEIKKSDVFVLSSDYEGIPNSLLEAMSIGVPVVSTDCSPGGARMLIEHNINGQITPCGNEEKLAEAIIKYFSDPDFAKACGINGRNVCNTFSPSKIVQQWDDYLAQYVK